jgi:CIC family chloride channel protein
VSAIGPPGAEPAPGRGEIAIIALVVGTGSGLLGAALRVALAAADRLRGEAYAWAHGRSGFGLVAVVAGTTGGAAVAAWLVRRFAPEAKGSGIPEVEVAFEGGPEGRPARLIPVKFLGGLLAIGSGLALGREGPSVQLGASFAEAVGRFFRRSRSDVRLLLAAGAGAGLATAFSAPLGGAVFVIEELSKRFDRRLAILAMAAAAAAIIAARFVVGDAPLFIVPPQSMLSVRALPVHLALGLVAGLLGVAYGRSILGALAVADRLSGMPVEIRAGAIGLTAGLLGWFAPGLIGGGDPLTQEALTGSAPVGAVLLIFVIRFALGPLCYAAGTPGGIFAPMLVLGAQIGLVVGVVSSHLTPLAGAESSALALSGMAAFFAAVVGAPLTGIVLVAEMTASYSEFLPMLVACFGALLVVAAFGQPPIYESLRNRVASLDRSGDSGAAAVAAK